MTRLVAKLVLAMLILPVSGAVFVLVFGLIAGMSRNAPPNPLLVIAMWAVVYATIALYWTLLWRDTVHWTHKRVVWTTASGPMAIVVGLGFGLLFAATARGAPAFVSILAGGGAPPIIWVLATVLIWRETPRERAERLAGLGDEAVACPLCGYNMTGLIEAVCPECGSRFTLEKLLACQPHRDQGLDAPRDHPQA